MTLNCFIHFQLQSLFLIILKIFLFKAVLVFYSFFFFTFSIPSNQIKPFPSKLNLHSLPIFYLYIFYFVLFSFRGIKWAFRFFTQSFEEYIGWQFFIHQEGQVVRHPSLLFCTFRFKAKHDFLPFCSLYWIWNYIWIWFYLLFL